MLDWEENLFLGFKALYRQVFIRPKEQRRAVVRVELKQRRASLLLLAEMLAGRTIGIFETNSPVLCGDDRIFLPAEFSLAVSQEANASLYELKTILAALALREGWHRNGIPLTELASRCHEEFPHLQARIASLRAQMPPELDLWRALGELPLSTAAARLSGALVVPVEPETSGTRVTTEIPGSGQAEVAVLPGRDDDGDGADLPTHTFEKVETLEEYTGLSRKSDNEDELDEHAEALSALKMTQVIRSPERPRSIYRGELILDGLSQEVNDDAPGRGIPYPEWDCRRRAYRPNWCFVQEGNVTEERPEWATGTASTHRALIQRLQRQFRTLTSDWLRLRRQSAGPEFDLDAVIDSEVERRFGHAPRESIYLDRRRNLHDIAALVLLDMSYSTDGWINNRRVLDVITETVFCVGKVLADDIERFALAAFTSNTRRACRFQWVKDFCEPWLHSRARLGALDPTGYTRIGPALRHAQELLFHERASRKIILLVTDGRPCDYDRYEGIHGIKDVKQAIETGQRHGILTHAFAVERQAAETFPQMFTRHHYNILPYPGALADSMCRLFVRLLAG